MSDKFPIHWRERQEGLEAPTREVEIIYVQRGDIIRRLAELQRGRLASMPPTLEEVNLRHHLDVLDRKMATLRGRS